MKILIWSGFVFATLLWTGCIALAVLFSEWLLSAAGSGQVTEWVNRAEKWPVPAWLGIWVDTELLQSFQASVVDMVQWMIAVMPSFSSAASWVSVVLWVVWGIVVIFMLAGSMIAHWMLGKKQRIYARRT
jgi:hypothetical protein